MKLLNYYKNTELLIFTDLGTSTIMNKFNYKDKLRRTINYELENKKKIKKSMLYNLNLKTSTRINITSILFNVDKQHSKIILNDRCVISGRSSKFSKNLKFSRLNFIRLARSCSISGLRKSYW